MNLSNYNRSRDKDIDKMILNESEDLTRKEFVKMTQMRRGSESNRIISEVRVYKRKWIILILFSLDCGANTLQFTQYSIIANIVSRYYNVPLLAVDWTAIIFMLAYIPLIIPATIIFEKIGSRWSIILGITLTCLGSWIKVFSAHPDRFLVTFLGQTLVATVQTYILSAPNRIATQWFDINHISTATSLGIFGILIGMAVGFLIPPIIVKNHDDLELIGKDLQYLFYLYAISTSVIAVLIIIFFEDGPELPPNEVRARLKINRIDNKEGFIQPIKRLSKNKSCLILCNSYGMNIGVLNALSTLLNRIVVIHFPGEEEGVGRIGLLIILVGMIGSVIFGLLVDRFWELKKTTVTVYFLTFCGQVIFAFAVSFQMWMVYTAAIFLGFFMSGYFSLGYKICAEYTYPEAEFITSGILNMANNVYGIAFILILGKLMEIYGDLAVHIGLCSALLAGFIMKILTEDKQRKGDARRATKTCPEIIVVQG